MNKNRFIIKVIVGGYIMKKSSLIITTMILFFSLTASVFAAGDYGNNPVNPEPTPPLVTPQPTLNPGQGVPPTVPAKTPEEIAKEIIATAPDIKTSQGEDAKVITVVQNAKLNSVMLNEVLKTDKPIYFVNQDQNVVVKLASNTSSSDNARDLSVGFLMVPVPETNIPEHSVNEKLISVVEPVMDKSILLIPSEKGEFGLSMRVYVKSSFPEDTDTTVNPYLYYLSDEGIIENHGYAINSEDGKWLTISINHASSYMISYEKLDAPVNMSSDNYLYNMEKNMVMDEFEKTNEVKESPASNIIDKTSESFNISYVLWGTLGVVLVVLGIIYMKKQKQIK